MTQPIVIGLLCALCVWLAIRWHRELGWKTSYDLVIRSLAEVAQARDEQNAARIHAEENCSDCFLDQAELRKTLEETRTMSAATETRLLDALDREDSLKRSNAALRGTVTRLTAGRAKKA